MFKKVSFPIILLFISLLIFTSSAQSQTVGVYVRTPSFVFAAGTPRYIIANDYPYSYWPYLYFPPVRVAYYPHHYYYYRHPVYYHHGYNHGNHTYAYGKHNGYYKHGRHH